ncbi:MAG: cell division protein FtsW [Phycisphaerales bacterium]|nr:cell division protein FtsW [Phycisphaerales bacterium]
MSEALPISMPDMTADTAEPDLNEGAGLFTSRAIIAIAVGLMGVGAIMTCSAGATLGRPLLGWRFWEFQAGRQILFILAGMIAMLVVARIPYRIWSAGGGALALVALVLAIGSLVLVYVPGLGVEVNQARRWVRVSPDSVGLRFQPSELIKIMLPIFLAVWLTLRVDISRFWTGLIPIVGVIGVCVAGIGLEDFGTAALLAGVAGTMLLVGGARLWHLFLMVLPALPAFGYLLISRQHRMRRLLTYLNIWEDPQGEGYQVIQSLCTIAHGGWWGRGLGNGMIKTYLPEARTDFIFAVICEELGIAGAAVVIALLIALLWQGLKTVRICGDPTGRLLAFGITITLGLQAAMNIAVVTVSVPTKGISLPLVSAGGSGAIFLGMLVGLLANIARKSDRGVPLTGDSKTLNNRCG